jgi:flagellar basal body-associated protein FliL
MSENKDKPAAKSGGGPSIVGMVLPAVFAAAAAFGGAKVAGSHHGAATAETAATEAVKPPGPTLDLEPFLLTVADANKKGHPMKVTIAIEFSEAPKGKEEDGLKVLTPRIRDATLGYLRQLTYESAIDPTATNKLREDLLEHLKTSGVPAAEHVLITDLVIQ